jgi:hypothetical protein
MRWSPTGAQLFLRVRTAVLNNDLAGCFRRQRPVTNDLAKTGVRDQLAEPDPAGSSSSSSPARELAGALVEPDRLGAVGPGAESSGTRPAPAAVARWDQLAGLAAAYRDTYRITTTNPNTPIGEPGLTVSAPRPAPGR